MVWLKNLNINLEQFKERINSLEEILKDKSVVEVETLEEHLGFNLYDQWVTLVEENNEVPSYVIVKLNEGIFKVPVETADSEVAPEKIRIFLDGITEVTEDDLNKLLDYKFILESELEQTNRLASLIEYFIDNKEEQ